MITGSLTMRDIPKQADDVPADDLIQSYSTSGGKGVATWIVALMIVFFVSVVGGAISLVHHEDDRLGIFELSNVQRVLFTLPIAILVPVTWWVYRGLILKHETGSRIDLGRSAIFWWDGPAPRDEHIVEIADLVRVTLEPTGANNEDILLRRKFRLPPILIPGYCVRDSRAWAKALISYFPHIEYLEPDRDL